MNSHPNFKNNKLFIQILFCFGLTLLSYSTLVSRYQNTILKLENPAFPLKKRIIIALKQTLKENFIKRIWVGYAITKNDLTKLTYLKYGRNKHFLNKPTLNQLITGNQSFTKANQREKNKIIHSAALLALNKAGNNNAQKNLCFEEYNRNTELTTEFAILMDYSLESGRPRVYQVYIIPTNEVFNLEGRSLYWLGKTSQKESVDWLCYLFYHNTYLKLRQQIITAVSYHTSLPQIFQFLNHIVFGNFNIKLKEDSILRLGSQSSKLSDHLLCNILINIKNNKLKKKAILALSQSKNKKAFKVISSIAKKCKNKLIRKEAIFCLSQMPYEKSLSLLKNIIVNDRDSEICEFTVFVISQIPDKYASSILKQIARTHPDYNVREKANYWSDKIRNHTALNYTLD